jgi:MerR family mercuric resistance operon transcriptional regulator
MTMEAGMETLTIGKLASCAGVGVETVRFYEREGLIPSPARRSSGYRQYPADTVRRIRFIRRAKDLGFTLKEIAELLSLKVDPETTCAEVRSRTEDKIAGIDKKMRVLGGMKDALQRLAAECNGKGPTSTCPILEALDSEEGDEAGG